MPNIKSAKKRVLISKANYEKNKAYRSALRTAMKKAEDSDKYIIRIFNPTNKTVKGDIKTTFKNAKLVTLNEEEVGNILFDKIEVAPYKIITVEVEKA